MKVYLICGVAGSGKTWVCRQLAGRFTYVPHDEHFKDQVEVAAKAALRGPVITESPFGERVIKEHLEANGVTVVPVFVIEEVQVIEERYHQREGKPLPASARTRARTILYRAEEWGAFHGTSEEVLAHMREVK